MKWQDKYVHLFEVLFTTKRISFKNAKKKTLQVPSDLYSLIEEDLKYINKKFDNRLKSENEIYVKAIADFFNCEFVDGKWKKKVGALSSIWTNNKKHATKIEKLYDKIIQEEKEKSNQRVKEYREKEKKEKENLKKENERLKQLLKSQGVDIDENEGQQ